ncbi:MAG: hypothetical protein JWN63_2249 [Candidatus Acidoferrum typicum]|nr:hypothetical protein [Candidatus Acidoferrum typicum]
MVTGAFFEPKALCGSTSGSSAVDCGAGGREAAFATTTDVGILAGANAAWESTLSGGDCANGCADGEAVPGDLCKDGKNRAHKPSKPTLLIPARIRRRFTRPSKIVRAICPCGRRYRILPRNGEKERVVVVLSSQERGEIPERRSSPRLLAEEIGSVVSGKF